MAVCPSCGATLNPPYRFCSSCGRSVTEERPYPPRVNYIPPKKDNKVLIVVVIVVVVIVLTVALPAILYLMVSGLVGGPTPGGPSKPTVTLVATKVAGGVSILVAGMAPSWAPGAFKVNIQNATNFATGTPTAMPTTAGTSVQVTVSGITFAIVWRDSSDSGLLSQGDDFVLTYLAPSGSRWTFLLIWAGDGSVVSMATWQA